tara:strand:+ start:2961 stop:3797 length:837 start_codon:yes stop_codon:yes gene_type:complete
MKLKLFDFYLKAPLYAKIEVNPENFKEFIYMLQVPTKFDGYNPLHKTATTFKTQDLYPGKYENGNLDSFLNSGGIYKTSLRCLRYESVFTFFGKYIPTTEPDEDGDHFNVPKTGTFIKIGQDVSLMEFESWKVKSYRKVLPEEKQKELIRAIGLASHGVGIGSFVYLRRIFEDLIEEAHLVAKTKENWNEEEYLKFKMADKIDSLKEHLPDFLVRNKAIYSILSKGIHELSEQLCLTYFDTILLGIERILEGKLELIKRKKRDEDAEKKIADLKSKLK